MKENIIHNDVYRLLILKLKDKRKQMGLKQEDFAKQLGRNQKYISRIESFDRQLNIQELWELCTVLDINFVDLLAKYDADMRRSLIKM